MDAPDLNKQGETKYFPNGFMSWMESFTWFEMLKDEDFFGDPSHVEGRIAIADELRDYGFDDDAMLKLLIRWTDLYEMERFENQIQTHYDEDARDFYHKMNMMPLDIEL